MSGNDRPGVVLTAAHTHRNVPGCIEKNFAAKKAHLDTSISTKPPVSWENSNDRSNFASSTLIASATPSIDGFMQAIMLSLSRDRLSGGTKVIRNTTRSAPAKSQGLCLISVRKKASLRAAFTALWRTAQCSRAFGDSALSGHGSSISDGLISTLYAIWRTHRVGRQR